jgi:hypothetical protein
MYNIIKRYGENIEETCGRKYPTLIVKEVTLYGGHDGGVTKYGCSFNTRSHRKITSLLGKSQ